MKTLQNQNVCKYYQYALGGFAMSKINLTLELTGSRAARVSIYRKGSNPDPEPSKFNWKRLLLILLIIIVIIVVLFLIYYFCVAKRNENQAPTREDLIA